MMWAALQEAYGNPHQPRRVKQVLDAAGEHGVDQAWAVSRRVSFLLARKNQLSDMIDWLLQHEPADEFLVADAVIRLTQKRMALTKEIRRIVRYKEPVPQGRITDEMVAQAREYPVEQLIDFSQGGKVMAWCHADTQPSLSWWKNGNKAVCWPCDKKFGPIDILMHRDSMTFIDAVRYLCR